MIKHLYDDADEIHSYAPTPSVAKNVVYTSDLEQATLKEKEREIPFLIKVMNHAIRENRDLVHALAGRLEKVANQTQLHETEDPKPDCYTLMGAELKELIIQVRTNNQYVSSMLEGLEI
jgi:hypothetical protein